MRLPRFDGHSDIYLFIQQFRDIIRLTGWTEEVAVVQLRSCLEKDAKVCGRADTVDNIYQRLLSTYGVSPSQAREKLHALKHESGESYIALGNRVEQLTKQAYGTLGDRVVEEMAIEHFERAVGNTGLRQHLLLAKSRTLDEVVRATEQFFLVSRCSSSGSKPTVASVEVTTAASSKSEVVSGFDNKLDKMMEVLTSKLDQQASLIEKQAQRITSLEQNGRKPPTERKCYECNSTSHLRRNCPTYKKKLEEKAKQASGSGNQ